MGINRMDNIGIVVEDFEAAKAFFIELGLEVEGETTVEGGWVDRVVGLEGVRTDIAILATSDGHGRIELMRFQTPPAESGDAQAPPNTVGIRRIAFGVDDLDATVARLQARGTELIGEVVQYEEIYRLCYIRGPEGIILMLSEKLG